MATSETLDPKMAKALGPLTAGMAETDFQRLMYVMCVFELTRNEFLVHEADHSTSLFVVQTGALRVTVGEGRNKIVLPEVTAGQWIGEIALLAPGLATATVQVVRPTTVLEFSHDALKEYMRTNPVGAGVLLEALAVGLANRLHRTSSGLIKNRAGQLLETDAPPVEHHGWFKEMLLDLWERH